MTLHDLTRRVDDLAEFDALVRHLSGGRACAQVDGLVGAARSLALARLFQRLDTKLIVVTHQSEQAQRLWDDLRNFGIPESALFQMPASESRRLALELPDFRAQGERIAALTALSRPGPCVLIGVPEAIFQRTGPPDELLGSPIRLVAGGSVDLDALLPALVAIGYGADTTVTRPGQFSRRGGILDLFPITFDMPVRMELFGDEIERLQYLDTSTQRSIGSCASVDVYPVYEVILSETRVADALPRIQGALQRRKQALAAAKNREAFDLLKETIETDLVQLRNLVYLNRLDEYMPFLAPDPHCALDYVSGSALVVVDEPAQVQVHWDRVRAEVAASREQRFDRGELLDGASHPSVSFDGLERVARERAVLVLSQMPRVYEEFPVRHRIEVSSSSMESYRARLPFFAEEVGAWRSHGATCIVVSDQPQRVREICREMGLNVSDAVPAPPEGQTCQTGLTQPIGDATGPPLIVLEGRLRQGLKFTDIRLYVVTDAELFGSTRPLVGRRRATGGIPISSILDLRLNDYVVHVHHGIGVYRGIVKRTVDGAERDFLMIQYAGVDRLFVPADQIDRVQRYIGGDGAPPVVNRIGGNEWQRTTRKVQEHARILARELIELYAARQAAERPSYGEDSPWQAEMEEAFPYDETPSQWQAILDVKSDLQNARPMDRLICGDVGFGKTEVAIRAAFRVIDSGKQVAVLCPTTVLAAQHHTTFGERLAAYPIQIELLSRFRDRREQRKTVEQLKSGAVHIVIGTHRLLSKDVEFERLGLLIVDEEQRFGVAQKERLKQLRRSVDVLTLTATPIPRTLSMALSGLRDMSVIEDPPAGRMPIVTQVREYNDDLVRDAILRELERDGQVYFVHNRVETIANVAQRIQRLVPDARIRIGHGQMSEDELEGIMYDFYHHQYDILVCTTIIENGLDLPNVNTIVVDRADRMGLAQLYQLRGRVGRSDRQAYAYLLFRQGRRLSEDAERRLLAIREFTELGSGFQIAMRDLEIRGAGNLLGAEQSGAMVSVGFDLYCQLLAQAVAELKGDEPIDEILPPADLPVTAHIPADYVPSEAERIFFYKRMSGVRSAQDIASLIEEMEDRYGDPPTPVWNAFSVLHLRLRAQEAGIAGIRSERKNVHLKFGPRARLQPDAVRLLAAAYREHRFAEDNVVMTLKSARVLEEVEAMLGVLEEAFREGKNIVRGGPPPGRVSGTPARR